MTTWQDYVMERKPTKDTSSPTWSELALEVAEIYKQTADIFRLRDKIRGYVRRQWAKGEQTYLSNVQNTHNSEETAQSIEYNKNGTVSSEKLLNIFNKKDITPEFLLQAHGFDALKWTIISCKNNMWNAVNKYGVQIVNCQSKITVQPTNIGLSFNDIEKWFNEKIFNHKLRDSKISSYSYDGEILEINLPDLHMGSMSWREETGEDYDIHIARQRFIHCMLDIIDRCKNRTFKKIVFITLGDVLHIDNNVQTTTKGTFQQADGRIAKIAIACADILIDAISMLSDIAPVEVIYTEGNHDSVSGFMLLLACSKAFLNNEYVKFDIKPNPRKSRLFGNALVGWVHGDMNKKYIGTWILDEAKEEYGKSKFVEVHVGHLHTENTKELAMTEEVVSGVMIRHLPNIASASYWEHKEGYPKNPKAVISYVWSETIGLREVWHSCV